MEDCGAREGLAATSGEKPLKGGCPWTIQHETWLADPRREKSREGRPGRSASSREVARDGRVSVDWQASEGPSRQRILTEAAQAEEAGQGVLQLNAKGVWLARRTRIADGSFGSGRAPRSAARKAEAKLERGLRRKDSERDGQEHERRVVRSTVAPPGDETARTNPQGRRSRRLR